MDDHLTPQEFQVFIEPRLDHRERDRILEVTSVKYFFPLATIRIPVTFFSPCSGFLLSGSSSPGPPLRALLSGLSHPGPPLRALPSGPSHPDLFLGFRLRPPLC